MPLLAVAGRQGEDCGVSHAWLSHASDSMERQLRVMGSLVRALLSGDDARSALSHAFSAFAPDDGPIQGLSHMTPEELFIGSDPYAKRGQPGCALFSLR